MAVGTSTLLVIFGAGASYDSAASKEVRTNAEHPYRPPLADELFADRDLFKEILQRFSETLSIVTRLRHRDPGRTVESTLEELQQEAVSNPRRHRQLMAVRFYLQAALSECQARWNQDVGGVTNYRALLDRIEQLRERADDEYSEVKSLYESTCLVTFNYDTLLDQALQDFGIQFSEMDNYITHPIYKLFKVHGSVNWAREVDSGSISVAMDDLRRSSRDHVARILTARAADLRPGTRFYVHNAYPTVVLGNPPKLVYPAIAIPVQMKQEFQCPDSHLQTLADCLQRVRKVLVIGWRATEQHFISFLSKYLPPGAVGAIVGGTREDIGQTERNLQPLSVRWVCRHIAFTDFIVSRKVDDFLGYI